MKHIPYLKAVIVIFKDATHNYRSMVYKLVYLADESGASTEREPKNSRLKFIFYFDDPPKRL